MSFNIYHKRGVSSKKEDVSKAIKNSDKGVFPGAFCKAINNPFSFLDNHDSNYLFLSHADGVGSKAALAYLYWKESGDLSVFENLAQDSLVMNIDDLLCVGCVNNFFFSSTIPRNKHRIPGEILTSLIKGSDNFIEQMHSWGINCQLMGGETADLGDVVKTLSVDGNVCSFMAKEKFIDASKIQPGLLIVGVSSSGQSNYETVYNSGIACNGLTSARHDLLSSVYKDKYPETYDDQTPQELIYCGSFLVTDNLPQTSLNIGLALLSPTRTYLPLVKKLLTEKCFSIQAILHLTGGGQTKCLNFSSGIHYVKDNLFELPPLLKLIADSDFYRCYPRELYQVFNCGHRLEIYVKENFAQTVIDICKTFNLSAKIIGYTESSQQKNSLLIKDRGGVWKFS
jgi:phosphoribosylformylglycinamidine cyclo-ligase